MSLPTSSARLAARSYPADLAPLMDQKWRNLLFLHWAYDPQTIQKTLPKGLTVDTFEGKAYVAVTPFFMEGVKPKFFPSIPGLSQFLEVNVRTYVYDEAGVPGVWFYSLDANQMLAVQMARQFFLLPYRYAKIDASIQPEGVIDYICRPTDSSIQAHFMYKGKGQTFLAEPETLEFFLVERYVLFASQEERLAVGRIHHDPYPLNNVELERWDSQLLALAGLPDPKRAPDHVLFSSGVDVEIFNLQKER